MKNINIDLLLSKFFDIKIFLSSIILSVALIFIFNYNIIQNNRIDVKIHFNLNKQKLIDLEDRYFGSKLVLDGIKQEISLQLKEKLYILGSDFEKNLSLVTKNFRENKIKINKVGNFDSPIIHMSIYNMFKGKNNSQYEDSDLQHVKNKINLLLKKNFEEYDFFIFLEINNFKNEKFKHISTFVFLLIVINLLLVTIKFRKKILS